MALSVSNLGLDGFENVEQIGTGGSSRVYRAHQVDLDRVVAIKVLNPGDDHGVAKRFDRERKAMGRLSLHEGIVPVYSSGMTSNGEPYLVMPYYPNGSLQDQIDAGPMEWQTAVTYVDVAAETIATAHDEGVVHLDLKPANIMLTNTGAPRIADFGIAQLMGTSSAGITAGTAFTPAYSAPETFLDGETGPPSDVYGLGATLWALLVGHPPFLTPGDDANLMAVIGRVVNNQVGDLRNIAPAPICGVIERAMAKRPQDRYQTARDFSLAIKEAAVASTSTSAPTTTVVAGSIAVDVAGGSAETTAHIPAGLAIPPQHQEPATRAAARAPVAAPPPASGPERGAPVGPPPAPPAPAPLPAGGARPLLQESAQPFPAPVESHLGVTRAPFIDLDRFRLGPIVVGVISFLLIVGAAVWAFGRQPDGETRSEATEQGDDPASPTTSSGASALTVGGGDSTTGSTTSTTAPSTSLTASTASLATTSTSEASTSTSESTTTTEATTSTSTSTSESTTTTEGTTSTSESTTTTETTTTTVASQTPEAPANLTAVEGQAGRVRLNWDAPADGPTPVGYVVLRNGTPIDENVVTTIYLDRRPGNGTFTYTVKAKGADDTLSPASNSATITVGPLQVLTFTSQRQPERVSVSFSASKCVTYRISATSALGIGDPLPETNAGGDCTDSKTVSLSPLDPGTSYQINLVIFTNDGENVSCGKPDDEIVRVDDACNNGL